MTVLGVSGDSVAEHKRFAEKYQLPFPLLSDSHKAVAELYDVLKEPGFFEGGKQEIIRKSFLIDLMGEIEKAYEDAKPKAHVEQVLKDLAEMRGKDA